MTLEKGDLIGNYKISLLLKNDGARQTYRARNARGLLCIVKVGASAAERDAAPYSPLFAELGDNFVVYRYVSGETLQARLMRLSQLSEAEAADIAAGLLDRLSELHKQGLTHGNLTADNIVIDLTLNTLQPFPVGLSKATHDTSPEAIAKDLEDVGRLIRLMLTGETSEKIRIPVGHLSLIETVMAKALEGEFRSAADMLDALRGKSAVAWAPRPTGPGFAAVAGMDALKEQLRTEVIDVLADKEEAARYGITVPNGMLLYGPPGCGKTFLAERFAEETGYHFRYIKSSDLASTYIHGSQEKIATLFFEARKNAPSIICFDEFDALVPRRDDVNNASHSGEVNEFLSQLNNCGSDGVFVIASTNRPDKIDPAVLRSGRIDYMIYVPIPDAATRRTLFELALSERPHDPDIDYSRLTKQTEGYLSSDIAAVVQQAARRAFRSKSAISMRLLQDAISERRPGVSKTELAQYEKIRAGFERSRENHGGFRIGFFTD